jgi:D-alanyl-D-alanine carboxypeptidase/D-alanyl-D-alanine-endopeptidase (penicillin-binding protein 4)
VKGGERVRRPHRLAWLSLALLSLFTMAAGTAVAHLLPARLALWRLPTVASHSLAQAGPVLGPAGDPPAGASQPSHYGQTGYSGPVATAAGVTAALSGVLGSPQLGKHVGAVVTDLTTGRVLLSRDGSVGFAPASTAKLAVAVAALHVLGPAARLHTTVVAGPRPSSIVLVGGGDPTLAAGIPPASDYPQPATLRSLAAKTARALRAKGVHAVRLSYDAALFSGPGLAPGWSPDYVTTGNVSPIEALEVDQGRLTAGGAPQDADVPGNFLPRSPAPAASAAAAFEAFLKAHGIRVRGPVTEVGAARRGATITSVSSPPLAEIVTQMLTESNNVIAENLARQVAIATGRPATFSGAAAAETAVLRKLGVRRGISLVDGSGLSPRDRIAPATLVQLIRMAAAPGQPGLRPVLTGMPVAGFSGTLARGGSVFNDLGPPALGVVRAKTGNLLTVASLAGLAYAKNGQLLAFAFMADRLPKAGLDPAADDLGRLATSLAGCGCH